MVEFKDSRKKSNLTWYIIGNIVLMPVAKTSERMHADIR